MKYLLLKILYYTREEEGFTLVELIVVVVIIGILSSIAIPSFQNSADKAKQSGASVLLSSYIKAAQAYKLETGLDAKNAGALKQYVAVNECRSAANQIIACKKISPTIVDDNKREWVQTIGYYKFYMDYMSGQGSAGNRVYIRAVPDGSTSFGRNGYGAVGCLNALTGAIKITNHKHKAMHGVQYNSC